MPISGIITVAISFKVSSYRLKFYVKKFRYFPHGFFSVATVILFQTAQMNLLSAAFSAHP